jgi:putative ABC transport system permease protein
MSDVRHAVRTLRRSPGFTIAALLSLSLGIGANTAIFTLANAVFLNPLPVAQPSRVLELFTVDHATQTTAANIARTGVSLPNTRDIAAQNGSFTGVAAYAQAFPTLSGFGKPTQENAFVVTPEYFEVLGVRLAAGRTFDHREGLPEAVLSHSIAQRLFGSDVAAPGRTINLDAVAYTVIGVAPAGFRGTLSLGPSDPIWLPISMHEQLFTGPIERLFNERRFRFLNVFARLKPGISETQADANLATIAARLEAEYPKDNRGRTFETSSLSEAALGFVPRGQTIGATVALSVAVGFVLLIACANLANLSLARAARRARETGVRVALGAGRFRLAKQLLCEAAILAAAGGCAGIGLGWAGARVLWASRPGFLTNTTIDLRLDWRICLFTAGLSALSCLLFGLAPVVRASTPDLSRLLNTSGRGNVQGGGRSPVRALLVAGEIAMALIALVGAGLFIRSMQRTQNVDPGFDTRQLMVAGLNLAPLRMSPERGREFMRAVVAKVRAVPGVESAAVSATAPLQGGGLLLTGFREGDAPDSRLGVLMFAAPSSPSYFDTMRVPLIEGRAFTETDRAGSAPVIVMSRAAARRMWPGQSALGKRLRFATMTELWEVVGIAKDVNFANIGEEPQMVAYIPFDQMYQPFAVLDVRTAGPPDRIVAPVQSAVRTLDSDLALVNPGSMQTVIGQALWAPRMTAALFAIFGMLGMTLAVIGVYGVMAYTVLQRTSEIGIRMAVGASPSRVLNMVLGESARLALVGIALGTCGALALTRTVKSLLFQTSPSDPATYVAVAALLSATALIAGAIPAWRASRIDPVRALRQE